ncbi:MAG TPA: BamA/TamA family outer membrane protein [Usitatibacter sp.]|nr:BamA/TamA family outer membrane protein [Usitatibacter sp.]
MRRLAVLLATSLAGFAYGQGATAPPADPSASERPVQPGESRQRQRDQAEQPRRQRRGNVDVTWIAPEPLKDLFEKFLPVPTFEGDRRPRGFLRPWMREVRRRVPQIAAAEGYFSPTLDIKFEDELREHATVTVDPGPRTVVDDIAIEFAGDLAGEGGEREARRRQIREAWSMAKGTPFRSADWEVAKTKIGEDLSSKVYATGAIASSEARVDAEAARAHLKLVLDSGPPFSFGDVEIEGLSEYSEALVRRVVDLRLGEPYDRERLTELQRAVQNGPWFSSVVVDIERDPARARAVPVKVTVTERPTREVGLAFGYGTDDGARAEAAFRHRNLFDRGFDLQSSLRVSQKRQIGFADVYLPPGLHRSRSRGTVPFQDSFGVLAERSDIEKLEISRFAVAGYRHFKLDNWELRAGLSYQIERSHPEGADERIKRALAPIVATTFRWVDDLFDPRKGGVLNLQVAAGSKALASGNDFIKAYGQYQHWVPITPRDQLLLRTELGTTIANSREGIPEDFLFRAGGSRSNRGYAYQALGVREGEAIVGGRYIATATAEFVHWLNEQWGAATFVDVGDAADTRDDWQLNPSYGVGARFKTPAGPFALDLAYAQRERRFRLSFSVTVAF